MNLDISPETVTNNIETNVSAIAHLNGGQLLKLMVLRNLIKATSANRPRGVNEESKFRKVADYAHRSQHFAKIEKAFQDFIADCQTLTEVTQIALEESSSRFQKHLSRMSDALTNNNPLSGEASKDFTRASAALERCTIELEHILKSLDDTNSGYLALAKHNHRRGNLLLSSLKSVFVRHLRREPELRLRDPSEIRTGAKRTYEARRSESEQISDFRATLERDESALPPALSEWGIKEYARRVSYDRLQTAEKRLQVSSALQNALDTVGPLIEEAGELYATQAMERLKFASEHRGPIVEDSPARVRVVKVLESLQNYRDTFKQLRVELGKASSYSNVRRESASTLLVSQLASLDKENKRAENQLMLIAHSLGKMNEIVANFAIALETLNNDQALTMTRMRANAQPKLGNKSLD